MPDLFISHASEDKATAARPLADALVARGLSVWYDEYTLTLGDSLPGEIDRGLAGCQFGVVVLSPNFFAKHWPRQELDALVAREASERAKRILPIWFGVDHLAVAQFSPILASKVGVSLDRGVAAVAGEIERAVRRGPVAAAHAAPAPRGHAPRLQDRLKLEAPNLGCSHGPGMPARFHFRLGVTNRGTRPIILSFTLRFDLEPNDPRRYVAVPEASAHKGGRLRVEPEAMELRELEFMLDTPDEYGGVDRLYAKRPWLDVTDHLTDEHVSIQLPTSGWW